MKNWPFLSAVSIATLVNCATHQPGMPVAGGTGSSACPGGTCPPAPTVAIHASATAAAKVPDEKPVVDDVERYRIPLEGPFRGAVNPKVNIVEFTDFQCPFCSQATGTLQKLLRQYPDDVRLYFRNLPMGFHADSSLAAQAAMAAHAQGKFWQMHDKLFEDPAKLKRADIEAYAREIGLDVGRFKRDLDNQTWKGMVEADAALASQMGVVGTPNFFINGRPLRGALPIEKFKEIVDDELVRTKKLLAAGTPAERLYAKLMAGALTAPPPPRPQVSSEIYKIEMGKAPRKGGKAPKITMVEFGEFQCPYSGRARNTLDELLKSYGDDLEVGFKHFPLPFHEEAMPAAIAAVAAGQQGRFWEMHDKLFANQQKLDAASLAKYAQEIGLDLPRFKADLASPETKAVVEADIKQAKQFGVEGTPSFFVNGRVFAGAYPLDSFKIVLGEEMKRVDARLQSGTPRAELYAAIIKDGLAKREPPKVEPRPGEPSPSERYKAEIEGAPSRGSKNALVTIVEFSDYECPFCKRAETTLKKILDEYKGRVRVVWRDLPLPFHPRAKPAAIAARAAGEQGSYWQMHDKLFENQEDLVAEDLEEYAEAVGLKMEGFKAAIKRSDLAKAVDRDAKLAEKLGVKGTPAFFINGKFLSGAQPFETFKKTIDEELAHARKLVARGTPRGKVYAAILKGARAEIAKPEPAKPAPSD
ncbi:MAG TPA: thioredoxin domain-containing protein [Polyangia bacterium]|jgi:Protein-disulfide isomerase|nr:thioredoxin domain-containing protein [Polyangia bacterium]